MKTTAEKRPQAWEAFRKTLGKKKDQRVTTRPLTPVLPGSPHRWVVPHCLCVFTGSAGDSWAIELTCAKVLFCVTFRVLLPVLVPPLATENQQYSLCHKANWFPRRPGSFAISRNDYSNDIRAHAWHPALGMEFGYPDYRLIYCVLRTAPTSRVGVWAVGVWAMGEKHCVLGKIVV